MTEGPPPFELRHIAKRYGRRVVLRDINLTIEHGECVALLGANGAGKTTLLRTMATLSRPTRGAVVAFGMAAWEEREATRQRLGVVAHQPWLYPELTCSENLRFFGSMFKLNRLDDRIVATLERVGLGERQESAASTLSRGLLQRLNLGRAIIHEPEVLLLDEPDTGLDSAGREVLERIVLEQLADSGSVVLTTHAIELALRLATRVVVVAGGAIAVDAARAALTQGDVEAAIRGLALGEVG
ncbi:MAG: heme ABC exporter ATP-binding protein CcmA [Thermomicrobiales bacterium]|nr:heme ABC exporter ATP-binding protein CcmA [Thermomicrobiales bacterium]